MSKEFGTKTNLYSVLGTYPKQMYLWIDGKIKDRLTDTAMEINVAHLEKKVRRHYYFENKNGKL